jgi:hypothetical protein
MDRTVAHPRHLHAVGAMLRSLNVLRCSVRLAELVVLDAAMWLDLAVRMGVPVAVGMVASHMSVARVGTAHVCMADGRRTNPPRHDE